MNECPPKRMFKKLTASNWREHDTTGDCFVLISSDGSSRRPSDDEWASIILEPELSPCVPEDVRNLFEVARGVLCYGYYFYPLYTLGNEQLFRVLDAAVSHRCAHLGAPPAIRTFAQRLEWMRKRGVISDDRYEQWDAARNLRNEASHANRQSLIPPTMAQGHVFLAAELINELFQEIPAREDIS